jgi:DNA polymerase-3 subunit delta'
MYRALNETSQFGGYRVALIEDADKMPVNAANSLLKTLEEPGQNTLLMLVSSHPHRLPITIRSRCQSVRFPVPAESDAMAWLQQEKVANAETALKLAHGAPLLARAYSEEQEEHRTTLLQALSAGIKGEPSFLYAQKLAQLPKEPLLRWLQDWASDIGRLLALGEAADLVNEDQRKLLETRAKSVDNRKLYQFMDEISRLQRAEGIALNQQLLWENLLISWDNV